VTSWLRRIDQVVPTLTSRDAIGHHVLVLREVIEELGLRSRIYASVATPEVRHEALRLAELVGEAPSPDRWLYYQLSVGSAASHAVGNRPEVLLVNYHNITPAELLEAWAPDVAEVSLRAGRNELRALASRTHFAVADSEFNRAELVACGYRHTVVAPLLGHLGAKAPKPDPSTQARLRRARRGTELLFVGKLSPHKAQHELVAMLSVYRRLYDPGATLRLVGSPITPVYGDALQCYAAELGVADGVELAGSLDDRALAAYFAHADAFVSASHHEGFCVPILEAMAYGVPVVATAAGAVPETVGDAGIVLRERSPVTMAVAVQKVLSDERLRRELVARGRARAARFAEDRVREEHAAALEEAMRLASTDGPRSARPEAVASGHPRGRATHPSLGDTA
jgi:glycosyltransferase involved in cell wall biosynthesis